ncbi:glucokinase [Glaciecola sp. XM2]|uniref:glucokinase n=1 Tax=Glaciecola sp. XM2 TaxID=1914931 RepID=UPI001BDF02AB|nr:glucokinase [Glaciecola sp. XM2]
MGSKFVADVGGTNIRLALVENGRISLIKKYLCNDFEHIDDAILQFQTDIDRHDFTAGCIGIACPVNGDAVKMTNHTWEFSTAELKKHLGLEHLYVINDFTAVAHSLPTLNHNQVIQIGGGSAREKGNIAVFGPGTGLGVEHLTWTPDGWHTLDGEGGHVDFAPTEDDDLIIWRYLIKRDGRASAEEVMSGRGIVNMYRAFCEDKGIQAKLLKPSEVTTAGINNTDPIARKTIDQYCKIMGSFASNLALNLCTTGGIFIGGGVTSKLQEHFLQSKFREKFEAKGEFSHYVKRIPTYLINEPDHGLVGALAYLLQQTQRMQDDE